MLRQVLRHRRWGLALGIASAVQTAPAFRPQWARCMAITARSKRSVIEPRIPRMILVRDDGAKVDIGTELDRQGPIYLNFVYTSCGSVCPVLSQTFSVLADRLGPERSKVRMISLSIDPEYDTPSRLAAYRQQFGADASWRFYTGSLEASAAMQRAFGVLSRDKMNHPVATFYRPAADRPWVRLDGFASPGAAGSGIPLKWQPIVRTPAEQERRYWARRPARRTGPVASATDEKPAPAVGFRTRHWAQQGNIHDCLEREPHAACHDDFGANTEGIACGRGNKISGQIGGPGVELQV